DRAVLSDDDAVGPRAPGRHLDRIHRAGGGIEPSDVSRLLGREPDALAAVVDQRVGVADRFGHGIAGDPSGGGIELADHAVAVAGVPDHAGDIHDEIVGMGPRVDCELREFAGLGIEERDVVALLSDEPDPALPIYMGIPWPAPLPRNFPFADFHRSDRCPWTIGPLLRITRG